MYGRRIVRGARGRQPKLKSGYKGSEAKKVVLPRGAVHQNGERRFLGLNKSFSGTRATEKKS